MYTTSMHRPDRRRAWWPGLALVALAACQDPPANPAAPASGSPEALRAAWRESITRRSAWQALVDNVPSLEKDDQRFDRLFETHNLWVRLPLSSEDQTDAGQLAAILFHHGERLGMGVLLGIEVTTVPPRDPPPPAEVLASQGVTYTDDQVVGTHRMVVPLPNMTQAEKFVRSMNEHDRHPILERLEQRPDGSVVVHGRYHFVRDIKPTRIEPDHYDVEAILAAAGGPPGDELVGKVRENYKKIHDMAAAARNACHLEARLKLKSARYSAFTRFAAEQDQKRTWESLVGGGPGAKPLDRDPHGHGTHPPPAPPSAPVTEPP